MESERDSINTFCTLTVKILDMADNVIQLCFLSSETSSCKSVSRMHIGNIIIIIFLHDLPQYSK